MSNLNLNNATLSNMNNRVENYEVTNVSTDSASGTGETEWTFPDATKQLGYFMAMPELKSALILKSIFVVGKGWVTKDMGARVTLEHVSGCGWDTFDDIIFNLDLSARIYGDSFAEIIKKDNEIINIKPLDTAKMKIILDEKGIVKRYEQISNTPNSENIKLDPQEVLHICNNRVGDSIHGTSDITALEETIKAEMENFPDLKKLMHRFVKPLIIFKLGTDDPVKIAGFVEKMDKAMNKGENVYIPDDENIVSFEVIQINPANIIMEWRSEIRNKFYRAIGLPEILPSGAMQATESGSKIGYFAFEQVVEREQRKWEANLWNKLYLRINLLPPASLLKDLQTDTGKDGQGFQPNDTQAGVGQ